MSKSDQISFMDSYDDFVEKFKPKKTTDDCYTPPEVYDVVARWATEEYGLEGRPVVRPFYPGGDYEKESYPAGCVVLDNPPFSILSKICAFYDEHGIDFFLFAPGLVLFNANRGRDNYVVTDANITYENGAIVRTGFVTNMGEWKIQTAPELFWELDRINKRKQKNVEKYEYPAEVLTAARLQKVVKYGAKLRIAPEDVLMVGTLDSQRGAGKSIYGNGFLLSPQAAALQAAALQAAAPQAAAEEKTFWTLSEREKKEIEVLSAASGGRSNFEMIEEDNT